MSSRAVGRRGTGGRQPRATPYTPTSATQELMEELGEPVRLSGGGVQALIFSVADDGDGVILARLSGQELQKGETALGQVAAGQEAISRLGRQARHVVVTLNNSGGRDYSRRPDFTLIEQAVGEGWCRWTAWRDLYRVEREPLPGEHFFRFLRETGTELILANDGGVVDWSRDLLTLRLRSSVGAEHRYEIKRQTHGALRARWFEAGRGWAGSKRFGLRRNEVTKYLEVDPEQWDDLLHIHYRYAQIPEGALGGLRRLSEEMAERGCELHPDRLRKILRDRIYVDGHWWASYEGERREQRPVELDRPVPEAVFERNRQLLGQRRGKNSKTPQGLFCLNSIEVVHERCQGESNDKGQPAFLRGRIQGDRPQRDYSHSPWVPKGCRGYRLNQAVLEAPVMRRLLDLQASPQLDEAWAALEQNGGEPPPLTLEPESRERLSARLRALGRQRARLERHFVDRLAAGEAVNERDFAELVAAVRAEEEQIEQRLAEPEWQVPGFALSVPARGRLGLAAALAEVLTEAPPDDPALRVQRAALVEVLLPRVAVLDKPDRIEVRLQSPLALSSAAPENPL